MAVAGDAAYYAFDAIGSTRQVSDLSGEVVSSYDYDPFGTLVLAEGSRQNTFQFNGRFGVEYDGQTLAFMRARFYSPHLGRFLSEDRFLQPNLYSFAENAPLGAADPTGLLTIGISGVGIVGKIIGQGVGVVVGAGRTYGFIFERRSDGSWHVYVQYGVGVAIGPGGGIFGTGLGGITTVSVSPGEVTAGIYRVGNACYGGGCLEIGRKEGSSQGDVYWNVGVGTLGAFYGEVTVIEVKWPPIANTPKGPTIGAGTSENITPDDPNEKLGPAGRGSQRLIAKTEDAHYTVYFENRPSASAPAQEVVVSDNLDPDLDWSSFALTEVAWGEHELAVPGVTGDWSAQHMVADYRPSVGRSWLVDVNASIDYRTGKVVWVLRTLDPQTGDLPADALAGFLPPNDASGRGEGHVSFTIRPRATAVDGTRIDNKASIVFDTNEPIVTNEVWNTIGQPRIYLPVIASNR